MCLHVHVHTRRVTTWLGQEDAEILEARQKVLENMEGIDVYVDKVPKPKP